MTTAANPEVERKAITPAGLDTLPAQKIVYEFWAIIVADGPTPAEAQKTLYRLSDMATAIFARNIRLVDSEGKNPLCATSDIFTQRRHEKFRGGLIEAMTIRIRPTVFVSR